ncbi:DNA replication protein [Rodentibacter pneumotropicus]|uniref:Uncharacterized protein n=1 Tax=Rodentibacter pneumotropicus TaxID=758 RepID=A0A448MND5_9PAST|nr:DNA replication protein [Rodentibacter pneumotropicus]NBH76294.1 DNA replication protein [Rodentibacter pneumotropicus]THA07203.1 DNA replication protein [Rodentibacter pneumotropicus]THA11824.1 DNA replication protein [Rodentibacter pneumotropicus]VEH66671.1 Uncharacterised protein [Rodentibacter pneumotropicus]
MKASESLRLIGQPIAYYKGLTKVLGGATATILFSQLYYWSDKTDNPLGVYKTLDELMDETGLTERELRSAREKLRSLGVVVETNKRLEHRLYFRIDFDVFDDLVESFREQSNCHFANRQSVISPNDKTSFREQSNCHFVIDQENTYTRLHTNKTPLSPCGESANADPVDEMDSQNEFTTPEEKTKSDSVDYVGIAKAYNQAVEAAQTNLSFIANPHALSDKRKRAVKKLSTVFKKRFGDGSAVAIGEYFADFLKQAPPFYFGENDRGWKADFEYLLRESTLDKVLEGNL